MTVFNIPELSYDKELILQAQSFHIPKAQWSCLLGPSGVGKTSLLQTLIAHTPLPIAFLTQEDHLLPWATVIENIRLGYTLRQESCSVEKVMSLLTAVGLEACGSYYPHQLSGGMKKRVALARILLEETDFVFLDEPFQHLDIKTREALQDLAWKMLSEKTVLMVSHDLMDCVRFSHNIFFLKEGKIQAVDALLEAPPRTNYPPNFVEQLIHLYEI